MCWQGMSWERAEGGETERRRGREGGREGGRRRRRRRRRRRKGWRTVYSGANAVNEEAPNATARRRRNVYYRARARCAKLATNFESILSHSCAVSEHRSSTARSQSSIQPFGY